MHCNCRGAKIVTRLNDLWRRIMRVYFTDRLQVNDDHTELILDGDFIDDNRMLTEIQCSATNDYKRAKLQLHLVWLLKKHFTSIPIIFAILQFFRCKKFAKMRIEDKRNTTIDNIGITAIPTRTLN